MLNQAKMADVVKWLTHQIVALAFRGFDSHRPPHFYEIHEVSFFIFMKKQSS